MRVTEDHADLRRRQALLGQLADLVRNVLRPVRVALLRPVGRVAAVGDRRRRNTLAASGERCGADGRRSETCSAARRRCARDDRARQKRRAHVQREAHDASRALGQGGAPFAVHAAHGEEWGWRRGKEGRGGMWSNPTTAGASKRRLGEKESESPLKTGAKHRFRVSLNWCQQKQNRLSTQSTLISRVSYIKTSADNPMIAGTKRYSST